jgi:hypothetical protein
VEIEYPAPYLCTAVAPQRAALERARDARVGHLADESRQAAFDDAFTVFRTAEDKHRAETGCTDRH